MPTPASASVDTFAAASDGVRWQLQLLGGLQAHGQQGSLQRWPSRAVALLLARLALAPHRAHAREELVELLWPGVAPAVGRNRLRQALSTLKALLEGPAGPPVLVADRLTVRVAPQALGCDALQFEHLVHSGQAAAAAALYRGPLLPGYYDEWVHTERERLALLHETLVAWPSGVPPAAVPAPRSSLPFSSTSTEPAARPAPAAVRPSPALHVPHYLTRLFGADAALAAVVAAVHTHRLVTLLGPGGGGKTRLAVEAAHHLARQVEPPAFDRVVFVPLAGSHTAAQLRAALSRALDLPPDTARDTPRLAQALAGQHLLLVLDNLEQLGDDAGAVLAPLLATRPELQVLATSRRALGVDGEQRLDTPPLPAPARPGALADDAACPAVALFVDRARAARADFQLNAGNQAAVVGLVQALQGLPLAIELAASRVRSIPPGRMLALWQAADGPLALLSRQGGRAGLDVRHASMTAVIDWSWQLLGEPERQLLAALALFSGQAGAPGLAAVLRQPEATVAARLDDLVGHSLVQTIAVAGVDRYALAEPVRAFVRARTPADTWQALRAAQQRWLCDWAATLGPWPTAAAVAPELATVLAVLADAATVGAPALQLAVALRGRWESTGLPAATQQVLEQALAAAPAQAPHRPAADAAGVADVADTPDTTDAADAAALHSAAHELLALLRFEAGFVDQARAHAQAALACAPSDAARARARVRQVWVGLSTGQGDDPDGAARLLVDVDLALAEGLAARDREAQAGALHQQAVLVTRLRNDWVASDALLAQSQALWQALGAHGKALARLRNRGQCWLRLGRVTEAQACFEHCEQQAAADGNVVEQIDSQLSLSTLLAGQRQWAAALQVDRRCLQLCWQHWHRHGLGYALWNPPLALARLRRPEAALQLMAFAQAYWEGSVGALSTADRRSAARVRRLAAVQVGHARADRLWAQGLALTLRDAVALALQA